MTDYRYIFLSLITDQIIAEIPLFGTYALRQLGQPGQFNGSFNLDQTGISNDVLIASTEPGRTWVVVERDNTPVWWGIVWSRTYQSQAKICELFCWGYEAYPQREKLLVDFKRTNTANTAIFAQLWQHLMLNAAGRNLNISINANPTPAGPKQTLELLASDHLFYNDPLDNLSNAADGFDWTIDLQKDLISGKYTKSLRIGFPTMGSDPTSPDITVFEYPGCILNYYATDSMADAATDIFAMGSGEGSTQLVATAEWKALIDQGMPRWDVAVDFKDVTSKTQLQQLANQELIKRKPPMPTYKCTVKGDQPPIFGSYNLGDACLIVITDARYPSPGNGAAGLNVQSIITGYEIRPPDSQGVEEINILLPGDVVNG